MDYCYTRKAKTQCDESLRVPKIGRDSKMERATTWERRPLTTRLVLLFPGFLPATLARQGFFHALLLARLQIKGVSLDLLDDVFLLYFALETAQCIL